MFDGCRDLILGILTLLAPYILSKRLELNHVQGLRN